MTKAGSNFYNPDIIFKKFNKWQFVIPQSDFFLVLLKIEIK